MCEEPCEWYFQQDGLHTWRAQPMTRSRASWHKARIQSSDGSAAANSAATSAGRLRELTPWSRRRKDGDLPAANWLTGVDQNLFVDASRHLATVLATEGEVGADRFGPRVRLLGAEVAGEVGPEEVELFLVILLCGVGISLRVLRAQLPERSLLWLAVAVGIAPIVRAERQRRHREGRRRITAAPLRITAAPRHVLPTRMRLVCGSLA